MPIVAVSVTEQVEVPEGATIVMAPTGVISGIKLADGTFLKPWITYELYEPNTETLDPVGDAATEDLIQLEVMVGLDISRDVTVLTGDVGIDTTAINVTPQS